MNKELNELKPVAWMQQQGDYSEPCIWEIDDDMAARGWRQEPLYAIPDTHRVVPVELLELASSLLLMHKCPQPAGDLRAIIDNKEQS